MSDDAPADPFREEKGGPWHVSPRQGEMLLRALADLPDATSVIVALKKMPRQDLECVVLERLYMWHASAGMLNVDLRIDPTDS